ncbi:MAG: hypothetical protein M0R46_02410 [Candidatus Muirbacterium halophilum]|nr:hypothetical protein [Candidatus Muirbacterium halophilum]MCK9474743.1 hypothetical protein [Candidatus Muirbacterium halophilum]
MISNRTLFINVENKKHEFLNIDNRKKGLFLGYYLYEEYCSKEDVVIVRGALSGLLPGICQCYIVYFDRMSGSISYSIVSGNLGANLFSQNIEAVVFTGKNENSKLYITIESDNVNFRDCGEIWDFDYILLKNTLENIIKSSKDAVLFSGNSVNPHYFSKINISSNEVFNCPSVSELLCLKGIKLVYFKHGFHIGNIDVKKEFFNIGKKFRMDSSQLSNMRSCNGCPVHCFSFISRAGKQNISYSVYRRFFNIVKDMLTEDFLDDIEKFFYLLEVFSIDQISILPVFKILKEKKELFPLMGLDNKTKFEFRDIVVFLKNLNLENNDFYNLLRTDKNLFEREYGINLRKNNIVGMDYALTTEEKNLFSKDFYPSGMFEYDFSDTKAFLNMKSLYEYFGICPNCIDIYDEYWVSKIGEKIDTQFSNIDRMNTISEIFFRYKHETEKMFTGIDRLQNGGIDE